MINKLSAAACLSIAVLSNCSDIEDTSDCTLTVTERVQGRVDETLRVTLIAGPHDTSSAITEYNNQIIFIGTNNISIYDKSELANFSEIDDKIECNKQKSYELDNNYGLPTHAVVHNDILYVAYETALVMFDILDGYNVKEVYQFSLRSVNSISVLDRDNQTYVLISGTKAIGEFSTSPDVLRELIDGTKSIHDYVGTKVLIINLSTGEILEDDQDGLSFCSIATTNNFFACQDMSNDTLCSTTNTADICSDFDRNMRRHELNLDLGGSTMGLSNLLPHNSRILDGLQLDLSDDTSKYLTTQVGSITLLELDPMGSTFTHTWLPVESLYRIFDHDSVNSNVEIPFWGIQILDDDIIVFSGVPNSTYESFFGDSHGSHTCISKFTVGQIDRDMTMNAEHIASVEVGFNLVDVACFDDAIPVGKFGIGLDDNTALFPTYSDETHGWNNFYIVSTN
jgi:hypothetical protein